MMGEIQASEQPYILADRDLDSKVDFKPTVGIRGLASIMILLGHFFTNFTSRDSPYPTFCPDYLQYVTFFFILSGTIHTVYVNTDLTWKDWMWRRFTRIGPLYFFSLLVSLPDFICYFWGSTIDFWPSLFLDPLFLQTLTLVGNGAWNPPIWQVSALMLCYTVHPSLVKTLSKQGNITLVILFICFYIFTCGLCFAFYAKDWPMGIVRTFFPVRLFHYAMGVILGIGIKRTKEQLKSIFADLAFFAMVTSGFFCAYLGAWHGSKMWWSYMILTEFGFAPLHCLVIYTFVLSEPACWSGMVFNTAWCQYVGKLSYAIYVLQWPVLVAYVWLGDGWNAEKTERDRDFSMGTDQNVDGLFWLEPWEVVPIVACTILFAAFANHYVENIMRDGNERYQRFGFGSTLS